MSEDKKVVGYHGRKKYAAKRKQEKEEKKFKSAAHKVQWKLFTRANMGASAASGRVPELKLVNVFHTRETRVS